MPTDSVSLTAHNVYAGGAFTFDWLIYDQCGNSITNPEQVRSFTIYSNTLDPDGVSSITTTLTDASLVAQDGSLLNEYTQTGYTTGVEYTTRAIAYILDASLTSLSVHKVQSEPINKKVRGGIATITPSISLIPGDQSIQVTFSANTISTFINNIADNSYNIPALNYAGMNVNIFTNDGTSAVITEFPFIDVINSTGGNNVNITGLVNGISYECLGFLGCATEYIAGTSLSSPGLGAASVVVPTDLPSPPASVAVVSTLEYNRDLSGTTLYTVTDASSATVLFTASPEAAATTTSYKIFRYDLSANGYTIVSGPIQKGTVSADPSFSLPYGSTQQGQAIAGGQVTYNYSFTDVSVTAGAYYAYYVVAVNSYGDGLASDTVGVRVGQQASPPSFTLLGQNTALVANVPSYNNGLYYGGFDSSSTFIAKVQNTQTGAITYNPYTIDSSKNVTIGNLTNGQTYNVNLYAVSTNANYTDPGTDISSNNTGNNLFYLGNVSAGQTLAPYAAPPTATNVTAYADISGNNFIGYSSYSDIRISWVGDTSYNGINPIGFVVTRYDVSNNATIVATIPPGEPPAAQTFLDGPSTGLIAGSSYTYAVQQYYVVNNTNALSAYSTATAAVIPFSNPEQPTALTAYSSGQSVVFSITPSTSSYPTNSGGLLPIKYNAVITNSSTGNVVYTGPDVSANSTYTITTNITSNTIYNVVVNAYVLGPAENSLTPYNTTYSSSILSSGNLQPTVADPVITSRSIDGSGNLLFTTSNYGNALNFAEAIIIDSVGTLNLAFSTNLNQPAQYITVNSNDVSGASITVSFGDSAITPNQSDPTNTLIVVTNSSGADVYDSLSL